MRGIRVTPAGLSPQAIAGRVLAHDVFGEEGEVVVPKGKVLSELDVEPLRALSWTELHLIELQPGDLHEDTAADRIAEASMGPGVIVGTPFTGARPLLARHRGLLRVDVEALRSVNRIDGVSLSTLLDGQVVEEGETVAVIKIVPLVIPAVEVRDATVAVGADGIVRVAPFRATRIGLVVCEEGTPAQRQRLERAAAAKIEWFGATLLAPAYLDSTTERIEDVLGRVLSAAPDVVLVVGAKPMDPLDPVFGALEAIGARMERHGFPAHPGSLLWIARVERVVILGIPSGALIARATTLDVALPRVLTGEPVDRDGLAQLGHGGLLVLGMSFRLPPYTADRGRGEAPRE